MLDGAVSMDSDDDICVLNHPPSAEDYVEDCPPPPNINFTPFSPVHSISSGVTVDTGSHHALQKAYTEVKRRLNESDARNRQLSRRVHELETNAKLNSYIGDSYDMMDDATYSNQGGMGQRPPSVGQAMGQQMMGQNMMMSEAQLAAEEGYQNNLQRQLARAKAGEKKYQDCISESERKISALTQQLQTMQGQLTQLSQDKVTLQQSYENVKLERDTAQQSVADLKKKCETLEIEKDKATKETAGLISALQKANQEVAMLKEGQGDSLCRDPPPELVSELAYMRRVIDSLKNMVLVQKKYLESRGGMSASMPTSIKRSMRDSSDIESDPSALSSSGRSSGGSSHSGQSWEVVNGTSPHNLDPRQQQHRLMSKGRAMVPLENGLPNNGRQAGSEDRGEVGGGGGMHNGPTGLGPPAASPKSKTDIIQRRRSDDDIAQPKSKSELIRSSSGAPAEPWRLADWMGNHYQRQEVTNGTPTAFTQAGAGSQPVRAMTREPMMIGEGSAGMMTQQGSVGMMNPQGSGVMMNPQGSGVMMNPQSPRLQQTGIQYPPFPSPSPQPSPQISGAYENVPPHSQNCGATTTSMHIVNQSGMAGARVIRNTSDSFGSNGGSTLTSQTQQMALTSQTHQMALTNIPINRDDVGGGVARGSPQEHAELTPTPTNPQAQGSPTNLHLVPSAGRIQFENHPMGRLSDTPDRKCPVCGQDFSYLSMDDFQTHVFECFDNTEESIAPETLQPAPEQVSGSQQQVSTTKVCPMCEQKFPNASQQFFEGHVQSHFEDVTDHFEVLRA